LGSKNKRMRNIIFELCAETIDACLAAKEGGAHRIELCSGLREGGLTPSHGLVEAAIKCSGLAVHVLVRPRGGSFQYTKCEVAVMREDIQHVKELGAAGVVLGLLRPDGSVDVDGVSELVQLAHPMKVTFHRAFDVTPSLPQALEDVIATGCNRVLTSGGQRNIVAGAACVAELVAQANHRIEVAVGGGLKLKDAALLARLTGAAHFHGSLRHKLNGTRPSNEAVDESRSFGSLYAVDADDIRSIIHQLQSA
jgi:copper homeostasis protein